MNVNNTLLYLIPPHYTGLLQACDVGINKSSNVRLKKNAPSRRPIKYTGLQTGEKVLAPTHNDVLQWLKKYGMSFL